MEESKIFGVTKALVKYSLLCVIIFLINGLFAQTPHIVYGEITISDETVCSFADIELTAFIIDRPAQVLTAQDKGMTGLYNVENNNCKFSWIIQIGDFPSSWSLGEKLNIEIFNKLTNSKHNIELILNEEPMQFCNSVEFDNPSDIDENKNLPSTFYISQNYPNPFNPSTHIDISIPSGFTNSVTSLAIFNILGKKIITLLNKKLIAGNYTVSWNGNDEFGNSVPSGTYFYYLKNSKTALVKKMTLLK